MLEHGALEIRQLPRRRHRRRILELGRLHEGGEECGGGQVGDAERVVDEILAISAQIPAIRMKKAH